MHIGARIKTSTHMTGPKGKVVTLLLLGLILIHVVSAQNLQADGTQLKAFLINVFPNYSFYFNTSLPVCQWKGVSCIGQGIQERIRTLNLSGLGLNGTILPGTLGVLSALASLDMSSNSLTGEIPSDIFTLTSLSTLNLADNRLTGGLPDSVGNLPQLGMLNASKNLLTGSLPWELSNLRSLQTLDLHENNFSGAIPTLNTAFLVSLDLSSNQLNGTLPYAFGGLNNLAMLNLSRNFLTGDVSWQFQNNKLLTTLDLSQNFFSGHLPALQNLQQLRFLSLASNRFNGSIPSGLIQLPSLEEISLANNGLTGPLPPLVYLQGSSISSNLKILDCGFNFLNGSIPEGFISALNLSVLRLASNDFTGPIPANLSLNLQELDLRMNHFSGNIPVSVANLLFLQKLDVSMNLLSGSIPWVFSNSTQHLGMAQNMFAEGFLPNFSQLTSLLYLNLSSCNIAGPIPSSLGALGSLVQLDISHNHLNGSIPAACSQMTSLNILNLSYNNLSGVIPPELVSLSNLQGLDLSYNNLSGEVPHLNQWQFFGSSSFQGNPLLCGFPTRPCTVVVSPAPSTTASPTAPVTIHSHHGQYLKPGAVVGIVLGVTLAFCCFLTTVLLLFKKRPKRLPAKEVSKYLSGPVTFEADPSTWAVQVPHAGSIPVVMFEKPLLNLTFADLLQATSNFHKDTQIADGGYGPTYKALLPGGFQVLIKVLFEGGPLNAYEKVAQLEALGKIRHPNLVALVGYCLVGEERLLLYEFMEKGDLQQRLHELPEGIYWLLYLPVFHLCSALIHHFYIDKLT